jgi:hypothetical protein
LHSSKEGWSGIGTVQAKLKPVVVDLKVIVHGLELALLGFDCEVSNSLLSWDAHSLFRLKTDFERSLSHALHTSNHRLAIDVSHDLREHNWSRGKHSVEAHALEVSSHLHVSSVIEGSVRQLVMSSFGDHP